jgi:hypothetical protein
MRKDIPTLYWLIIPLVLISQWGLLANVRFGFRLAASNSRRQKPDSGLSSAAMHVNQESRAIANGLCVATYALVLDLPHAFSGGLTRESAPSDGNPLIGHGQ